MKHFARHSIEGPRVSRRAANEDLPPPSEELLVLARQISAIRAGRSNFLSATLLSEPGYDMMLAMFIAAAEGRPMRAADLALAGGVPSTTALRWIKALEQLGLIARAADHPDLLECSLELTPEGHFQVRSHIESAWRAFQA